MAHLLQQLLVESRTLYQERIAVRYQGSDLTYRELDESSNQLAHLLREEGLEKGDRVGIYLEKSVRAVAAIFGVLKAGGVYVPLDPTAPTKRIAYIVDNCAMRALVTTHEKAGPLLPELGDQPFLRYLIFTDEEIVVESGKMDRLSTFYWNSILGWPDRSLPANSTIESDLAYILYTSGSTGDPKGVMISHRTSLTFVNWAHDTFQLQAKDRVSNHAPFHFDLSILDIFSAIEAGATVILVPKQLSVFPRALVDFIEKERISVWYSVPSILTFLVLHGQLERYEFRNLRTILFAGEVFPIKFLRRLKELIPNADYYNLFGPTETNVCTYYKVPELPAKRTKPLSIGKACSNTEVFAINEKGELATQGAIGELYVRGPGIMQGYWGLQKRTARALVLSPIHTLWNEIVYRTGDMVRLEEDGNYTFLGRRDHQIKSRGYRIELGEIEAALYSHPQIEEAVAIAIPDEEIGNVIKAVVVPRDEVVLTAEALARHCGKRLPRYMIPSKFEIRDLLPKTSTGKVNRTLLMNEHLRTIVK